MAISRRKAIVGTLLGGGASRALLAQAERVAAMTERVLQATRRAGKAALVMPASAQEAAQLRPLGVGGFIVSSDQGFLRSAASQALSGFHAACATGA